jgi:hypothetical protein
MKKIVLTFGLLSGLIISGMFVLTIPLMDGMSFEQGAVVGYASMLAASLLIYFGIRSYRDNVGGGVVRFGRAFAVGILIVTVSNVLYVATWKVVHPRFMPDFYQKYEAAAIEKARARNAPEKEIEDIKKSIVMYQHPILNPLITFLEPMPVGLLVTLISAWVLSRRRQPVYACRPLALSPSRPHIGAAQSPETGMAINTGRVVAGGLVAGLVMNVSGFLVQGMLLGKRMEEEMVAVAPTLQGKGMDAGSMTGRVLTQFAVGVLLVWLYAAMRPRFGAGPKTAMYAAFVIWLCGFLFYLDWLYIGMMSPGLYAIVSIAMAITLAIAAWVGGMIYKEEGVA